MGHVYITIHYCKKLEIFCQYSKKFQLSKATSCLKGLVSYIYLSCFLFVLLINMNENVNTLFHRKHICSYVFFIYNHRLSLHAKAAKPPKASVNFNCLC